MNEKNEHEEKSMKVNRGLAFAFMVFYPVSCLYG